MFRRHLQQQRQATPMPGSPPSRMSEPPPRTRGSAPELPVNMHTCCSSFDVHVQAAPLRRGPQRLTPITSGCRRSTSNSTARSSTNEFQHAVGRPTGRLRAFLTREHGCSTFHDDSHSSGTTRSMRLPILHGISATRNRADLRGHFAKRIWIRSAPWAPMTITASSPATHRARRPSTCPCRREPSCTPRTSTDPRPASRNPGRISILHGTDRNECIGRPCRARRRAP